MKIFHDYEGQSIWGITMRVPTTSRSSLRNYCEHLPHVLTKLRPITPLMVGKPCACSRKYLHYLIVRSKEWQVCERPCLARSGNCEHCILKYFPLTISSDHGSNASQTGPGDMNAFHIAGNLYLKWSKQANVLNAASSGFTPICRILFNFDPNVRIQVGILLTREVDKILCR